MPTIIAFIWRFAALLVLYQIARAIFFVNNLQMYSKYSVADIFAGFLEGARFDASAIALLNAPYFLILIWPLRHNIEKSLANIWLKIFFVLSNAVFISFNIFDAEYYKFIGRRLTVGSFAISKDINDQFFKYF